MGENKGLWIGIVVVGCLATGVGLYLNSKTKAPPPPEPVAASVTPAPGPAPAPAQIPLPSLAASDAFMRQQGAALSSNPGWADWLKQSELVRRFAAAAEIVANGKIPKDALDFLIPKKKFATVKNGGNVYSDPKNYARYDAQAAVIESIDASAAAKLFTAAKPLLDEACQELGRRSCDIKETALRDIKTLLAVPSVDGPLRLRAKVVTWAMLDDNLENLSPPQKILIRMGPRNGPKVQAKLREFALALGAPATDLPNPGSYSPHTK
ncbi:MAG: DUF3014 domain-containing protein [Elusimicrobia bacterium]|nr:DUF3014 domain-containing protein [Elusimicrobiota bacterium]